MTAEKQQWASVRPLSAVFHLKEPELLGEMFDSRSETGNVQDKPGTPYQKQGSYQRLYQKDARVNLKRNNLSTKRRMTQWTETHQRY